MKSRSKYNKSYQMKGLEALYMYSVHTVLIECKQVCKDSDVIYEYCVTSKVITTLDLSISPVISVSGRSLLRR
jgi:hypothetical protein